MGTEAELTIGVVVLLGVGVVLPLALGAPARWLAVSALVALALVLPVGWFGAVLALAWPVAASAAVVGALSALTAPVAGAAVKPSVSALDPDRLALVAASGFAVVAGSAFVASRAGWSLFGIREPIVELTAAHFTYAGVGATCLARAARRAPGARTRRVADVGLLLTLAAPPVVAVGFLAKHPLPQVGGALLMTGGVLCTASVQLAEAWRGGDDAPAAHLRRVLLGTSGILPWIPMGLALSWAASNYWDVPALSIPDMARTHGVANAGFVITGLTARSAGFRERGGPA